jgi:hypothetical protein
MRIVHFEEAGAPGIAVNDGSGWHGLTERESGFPGTLPELIAQGADLLRTGTDLLAGMGTGEKNGEPNLCASAGRRLAGENRQLRIESTLVGGPRFAARDIS